MRAVDQIGNVDKRRIRATNLTAALMQEVMDVLPERHEDYSLLHDRLMNVLYENGAAWTTEEERLAYGFEPRDDLGWTSSERVEYEMKRREVLTLSMLCEGE